MDGSKLVLGRLDKVENLEKALPFSNFFHTAALSNLKPRRHHDNVRNHNRQSIDLTL